MCDALLVGICPGAFVCGTEVHPAVMRMKKKREINSLSFS
jgi:hypothetical protein